MPTARSTLARPVVPRRLSTRRPPTLAERLLGRRRATLLRRRAGMAALGAGFELLRPRSALARGALWMGTGASAYAFVTHLRF